MNSEAVFIIPMLPYIFSIKLPQDANMCNYGQFYI